MSGRMLYRIAFLIPAALALALTGCTTKAGKRAMAKEETLAQYSGFDSQGSRDSERKAEIPDEIPETVEAEKAVEALVLRLQNQDRAYIVSAEDQLFLWSRRPGVKPIIVNKVSHLLKHPRVEVRAPAIRLFMACGTKANTGDLIELLADNQYLVRQRAFRSLRRLWGIDFGYKAEDSKRLRNEALNDWRQWWQEQLRKREIIQQPDPIIVPPVGEKSPAERK